ncbi:uncharacterized protein Z518_11171 [Rhinocladiella mackenziei CBS 650.93]|uniref:CCHC-type domain-containing protein n=1 Tax=Rhinocladiella mackenziei CBS 650.93 TaxID=1442369 RepID=A0A0D2GM17_9EURO|nr:uncharacterized protein Z518_11171 [Rhinocladiella mackenziei CBS 650.93]KIW99432.1 hypothetical protein Z518_11171 [Rhinocladiella mackenziei CBS 650.93]
MDRGCYNCGDPSHQARDCPKKGTPTCYNCGAEGHAAMKDILLVTACSPLPLVVQEVAGVQAEIHTVAARLENVIVAVDKVTLHVTVLLVVKAASGVVSTVVVAVKPAIPAVALVICHGTAHRADLKNATIVANKVTCLEIVLPNQAPSASATNVRSNSSHSLLAKETLTTAAGKQPGHLQSACPN